MGKRINALVSVLMAGALGVASLGSANAVSDPATSVFEGSVSTVSANRGFVDPGESFNYVINWENTTENPATLVQLMPYNGDARGTTGLGATPIQILSAVAEDGGVASNVTIQYTTMAPEIVGSLLASDPAALTATWTDLPGTGVVPSGATAIRLITAANTSANSTGSATISVKSPQSLTWGGQLCSNLYGSAERISGDPTSMIQIDSGNVVTLLASLAKLSGTVYRDLAFNGVAKAGYEWDGLVSVVAKSDTVPTVTYQTSVNAFGYYEFTGMLPGSYQLTLSGATGWSKVSPKALIGASPGSFTTGVKILYREDLNASILAPVTGKVSQGETTSLDVTSSAVLGFPTMVGSVYTKDGVGISSATPTSMGGIVVVDTAIKNTKGQSFVKYTASPSWPSFVSGTSYTDTFTYSYTNAAGEIKTALATITVYRNMVAVDVPVTIKASGATQVTLPDTVKGDQMLITKASVISGDMTVATTGSVINVTPSHTWVDNEISHSGVISYTVTDSQGKFSTAKLEVTVLRPPVLSGTGTTAVVKAGATSLPLVLLNPEAWAQYAIPPALSGVALAGSDATQELTYVADTTSSGSTTVVVTATDILGQTGTGTYVFRIQEAPTANGVLKDTVKKGSKTTFNLGITTSGTIKNATVSSAPTAGVVVVGVDGKVVFDATATSPGKYPFTVTFTDDLGQTVDVKVNVTVTVDDSSNSREIVRYAGENRYETSLNLNSSTMVSGAPVFVAAGASFPDALSVAPAVRLSGGSLVLSGKNAIDQKMLDLIISNNPSKVYLIGGTNTLSEEVERQFADELGSDLVERVQGDNRYQTSAEVFRTFFAGKEVSTVFVASGTDFPDALTASAAGGAIGAPVLLVNGKVDLVLTPKVSAEIEAHGVTNLILVGGTSTVNAWIENNMRATFAGVTRKAGANRYGTNQAINKLLDETFPEVALDSVWLADGRNFPDALSAAVPAGLSNSRLVLSAGKCIESTIVSRIIGAESQVTFVGIVGGSNSLAKPEMENLTVCN